jgi:protein NirF
MSQLTRTAEPPERPDGQPLALVKQLRGEGLVVVDADRHERITTIGSGRQPHALARHPRGRWGYVPYMGSNTLEVVDLHEVEIVDRVPSGEAGTAPVGAATTRDGEHLFVSTYGALPDHDAPGVTVFETAAGGALDRVAQLPLGKAAGIVADATNDIWVALTDADAVVRCSGTPPFEERDRLAVPDGPQELVYSRISQLLAVNAVDDDSVTFIHPGPAAVQGTVPAPSPRGGTIAPAADRWFVGNTEGDGVTAIDLTAVRYGGGDWLHGAATPIPLGTPTAFTDLAPGGDVLAIDAYDDDRVTFLDTEALEPCCQVRTGGSPHHPRFSADGNTCYVPCTDEDTVVVIDTSPLRSGSGELSVIERIDLPDGVGPSGCFRTDRRDDR